MCSTNIYWMLTGKPAARILASWSVPAKYEKLNHTKTILNSW